MKHGIVVLLMLVGLLVGPWAHGEDALAAGQKAPGLALTKLLQAPDGAQADLGKLRGKVVVLEFWATWCGPCVAAIPHLNELADQFKDKPVQFIAISTENEDTLTDFLKRKPLHAWIGVDKDHAANNAYHVVAYPTTVVIRADGTIDALTMPALLRAENLQNLLAGKASGLATQQSGQGHKVMAGDLAGTDGAPSVFQIVIRKSKDGAPSGTMGGGAGGGPMGREMGRSLMSQSALELLSEVYNCTPERVVVNGELPGGKYDMAIKGPQIGQEKLDRLAQEAVECTFGLTAHRETRPMDVYVMTVDPAHGGTLKATEDGKYNQLRMNPNEGTLHGDKATMRMLTQFIARHFHKIVIDETKLAGCVDCDAKWDPAATPEAQVKSIADQLGLVLTPAKRPIDVVVVEASAKAATRPTAPVK